jgi:uncharacterized protein (DUF58 family)
MLNPEIMSLIHQLELSTKVAMRAALVGDTRQRDLGFGSEFDQIREYSQGDDIRFIDWRGFARTNKLLVRQYRKQISKKVYVLLDLSSSTLYGSGGQKKIDSMRQAAAALVFAAGMRNDSVGLIAFSDTVHTVIKPKRSRSHIRVLVEAIFSTQEVGNAGTNIACAIERLLAMRVHESLVCVVSDMIDDLADTAIAGLARRCDVVVLRCMDALERGLPSVGLLRVADSESSDDLYIDLRSSGAGKAIALLTKRAEQQKAVLREHSIDLFDFAPTDSFVPGLVAFFAKREMAL